MPTSDSRSSGASGAVGRWSNTVGSNLLVMHNQLIEGLQRLRSQSVKGTVESTVLRHRLAVEIRELTQRVAVSDPFAQLAKIPILDPFEDQGAQHLLSNMRRVA